jgi:aryl-alcohol dehydrogenase-like predicted oxidoreductase
MDQIRLGNTGLHVSRVCLGMMSCGNDSERPWVLDQSAVEPMIVGATKLGHLQDALAAAELTLSEQEIERLQEPYPAHPTRF